MSNQILLIFLSIVCLGLISSCQDSEIEVPDISDVTVDFDFHRSEIELLALDTMNTLTSLDDLLGKDSSFYSIYFPYVLRVPLESMTDDQKITFINGLVGDSRIQRIAHEVDSVFGDFSSERQAFEEAFKYLKYYFPDREVPDVHTYISEYSLQRFLFSNDEGNDALALGLDMFLGENYPYKQYLPNNPSFSDYLVRRYTRDYVVKRGLEAVVEDKLGEQEGGETLLDRMIYNGKKLYILKKLLPFEKEEIIMEYTEDQLAWCKDNEEEMWAFFFKEDLFYSTDINKISKLVSPSPNSSGMPPEAPGRTANYMGLQIVEAYMARNKDQSIEELITFGESQKLLEKSKFKPKRR